MSSTTRRDFLKQSALASAGTILVGFQLPVFAKKQALVTDAFIRLELDGAVTLMMNHAEFGNGAYTSLSMMVAEELDLDWQTIKLEAAPTEQRYYSPLFGEYLTAGSVSTASSFMPMREAGARTRQLLLEAASIHFSAPISSLRTADSKVHHRDGRSVSYAALIAVVEANGLKPPEKAKLKNPEDFAVLGKPQRRIEAPEKVDGSAIFGSDIRFDDMLFASIVRPPVYGGFARDFDGTAALAVKGVVRVKKIDAGIAVLARDYWTAKKAAGLVTVSWEDGGNGGLSTKGYSVEYRELSNKPGLLAENIGRAEEIIAETEDGLVIESVYEMPYLAHATMEPMNCTAKLAGDRCEIWVGTQYQSNDRTVVAKMLGVPEENVVINRTLSGGTFGRRASKTADFVTDAVQAASGENVPVQVIWSREEDIRGGHYRPQFIHRLKGVLDNEGYPLAWHQRVVGKSIMQNTKHDPAYMVRGMDIYSLDGCLQEPFGVFPYGTSYEIPNHRIESHNPAKTGVRPHEWRAVGHTHTGIAYECFLDELADKGNKDPLDLRLHLSRKHTRMHNLLEKLKKVSNWEQPLAAGRGRGMAARVYSNSWIAQSVELTVDEDGSYSVDKVFCVVDCGFAVNPLGIQGQIEGGIMLGLNAVAYGAIDVVDGRVVQSNFHDYRPLRMHQMPEVEIHIMPSELPPTGVGEQSTTPIAPAIGNAIFNATGKRVRDFPLDRQGFVLKG